MGFYFLIHSLHCVLGDDDIYRRLNVLMQSSIDVDFFTEYGEGSRYKIEEVIGKGSYGVVCSAYDTHTGDKVAIKKINDIFEHVSDATRILREIKLLRLLRHPDIVEIKHILLPPSRREFRDIYVVFELMESDLHQVIKANDDLTPEHYQFFLYQLLRGLKYIHTGHSLIVNKFMHFDSVYLEYNNCILQRVEKVVSEVKCYSDTDINSIITICSKRLPQGPKTQKHLSKC